MIVDIHTHVEMKMSEREREYARKISGGDSSYLKTINVDGPSFNEYWEAMKPVDRAIIVNPRYEFDNPKSLNDHVAKIASSHEEKLIAYCSVMPDEENPAKEVRRCIKDLGMKGVKLYPVLQRYPPNNRKFYPIYEVAQELQVPVALHMGTQYLYWAKLTNSKPLLLEDVAIDFPDLKIICAHLGHPWIEDTIMLVRKAPNVYTDISGLMLPDKTRTFSILYRGLILAYEYGVLDKILFGTDYPVNTPANCIEILENINHFVKNTNFPRVPEEAIHNILHENWKKVIKIN